MVPCGISTSFPVLFPTERKVAHALLTRPPLEHLRASSSMSPLDLHVLSTPPAFVLSQDQTLSFNPVYIFTGLHQQDSTHSELLSFLCVILRLYRFQGSVPLAPERRATCISYQTPKGKSTPFYNFFDFFAELFGFPNIFTPTKPHHFAFRQYIPTFIQRKRSGVLGTPERFFSHLLLFHVHTAVICILRQKNSRPAYHRFSWSICCKPVSTSPRRVSSSMVALPFLSLAE